MAAYNFKSFVLFVVGLLAAMPSQAHAQATLLLEEPYSYDGTFAGTGHAAVYLSRVCAETPITLRRCGPGETGVVLIIAPDNTQADTCSTTQKPHSANCRSCGN